MRARRCFAKGIWPTNSISSRRAGWKLVEIGQTLEPGKIIGEIAFFSPSKRRTHTARCVDDCSVLMIDESTVKQLYFQNPSFGFHRIGLVAGRLSADCRAHRKKLAGEGLPPRSPQADEVI